MTFYSAPVIAAAGITFFAALYHFAVFIQRPKAREYLVFALLCFAIGVYDVFCIGLYNVSGVVEGAGWQRLQVVALAFMSTFIIWFFADALGLKKRLWVYGATVVNGVFAVLALSIRSSLTWDVSQPMIKTVPTVFGPIIYYEAYPGIITNLQSFFGMAISACVIMLSIRAVRRNPGRDNILMLVALLIFALGVINDTLVSMGLIKAIYTIEYAYLAFVLIMTFSLSIKVVESAVMKDALESRESLLSAILDNASAAIALCGVNGQFIRANRRFAEMFGYSTDEVTAVNLKTLCGSEGMPIEECLHQVASGTALNHREERSLIRKNNDQFWGDVSLTPVSNTAQKGVEYLVLLAVDTTQRKTAEQQLEAEKNRLLVTLRSIGDGVIATTMDGRITLMNPVAETLTGWSEKESAGRLLEDVFVCVDEYTRETAPSPIEEILRHGADTGLYGQTILLCRNGRDRVVAHNSAPLRGQDGGVAGVVLVFRDVTEKGLLERKVANVQRLESLGILAGGIAHDFNNLLTGVFGFIQLAGMSAEGNKEVVDTLNEAGAALGRARDFTRQLLTFSKGGQPVKALEELGPLITDNVRFALSGSTITPVLDIPEKLWVCNIDSNQIGQVIDNLVINALQAMSGGGTLLVSARNIREPIGIPLKPGCYVRVTIRDTGTGIPHHLLERVFDPFFTTKQKGSGLGLATVHSIIQKHEGHIDVESVVGIGTAFHMYLPAVPGSVRVDDTDKFVMRTGSALILVVDDDPSVRLVAQRMLERAGHRVTTAMSGEAALQAIRDRKPGYVDLDLAILDLTIPGGLGGKELADRMKELVPDLRCVAASGYFSAPVMAHPREHGFRAAIQKPFTIEELTEGVWNVLKEPVS